MVMKRALAIICAGLCSSGAAHAQETAGISQPNAYQFSFQTLDGTPLPLEQFRGKVLLVINTASACGLTPQYAEMQQLYDAYKDRGLVVLAVPSNDFGQQETGSSKDIATFTSEKFQATFPITGKEVVSGKSAHPFYLWANQQAGFLGSPKWNFHKYLIDRNGDFVGWYSSPTAPTSDKIKEKIESLLAAPQ